MRFLDYFFDLRGYYKVLPLVALILFEIFRAFRTSEPVVFYVEFFLLLDLLHKILLTAALACTLFVIIVVTGEMFRRGNAKNMSVKAPLRCRFVGNFIKKNKLTSAAALTLLLALIVALWVGKGLG